MSSRIFPAPGDGRQWLKSRKAAEVEWLKVAAGCEHATFFHTPWWHQIATRTYPQYRDVSLMMEAADGDMAVLPLLELNRKWMGACREVTSTFAGCYGGIVSEQDLEEHEQSKLLVQAVGWNLGRLRVNTNPFSTFVPDPAFCQVSQESTHVLRLRDFDHLLSNFSAGHRRNVAQGRRFGVTTRVATHCGDYAAYYQLYEDSLQRWGDRATSRYPWLLFKNIHELANEHPRAIKLWSADREGAMIAGAICFYWNRHVVYWHGAAHSEHMRFKPANVLMADIIRDACTGPYEYFDFNPSGGHEGVAAFKQGFGAQVRPFHRCLFSSNASSIRNFRTIKQILRGC